MFNPIAWLEGAFTWVKNLLAGITAKQSAIAAIVVSVLKNIDTIVLNPGLDILTALIPGDIDNEIVSLLRTWIPKILAEVVGAETCLANEDLNAQLACIIEQIQTSGSDANVSYKNIKLLAVGSGLTQALTGLDQSTATMANEAYYKTVFKAA